jgi:hypothetical protein
MLSAYSGAWQSRKEKSNYAVRTANGKQGSRLMKANAVLTLRTDILSSDYEEIKRQIELYQQRVPYPIRYRLNLDFEVKFAGYCKW